MATFRSGFKIFGELSLRQSIGRVRSFSEDRKPGSWLPEDQWAVRPPCTTCPDPCAPKKPAKPSKSWLSICKDPEPPITCDIRHNNCPPPQKDDEPWYAFLTKKKPEKPKPPLNACRAELQREAENPSEDYCEDLEDRTWPDCYERVEPDEPVCIERPPAPVIRLSCPPPKDLDLMLWCGKPGLSVARIASQCQTDRMPYEEFRPKKCWKPPPFSLPTKCEAPPYQPFCSNIGRAPLAEYKQVEIPKPLYTRYKSVELEDENFLLCMTDARCPTEERSPSLAIQPPPLQKPQPQPEKPTPDPCPEKPILVAASQKPVKLKCAPKFKFRPKPTKLVERRTYCNPCAHHNTCNLSNVNPPPEVKSSTQDWAPPCTDEAPKVITNTLTDEPPVFQRSAPSKKPPHWMYMLSKPGSKDTPLVPHVSLYPSEPDWCGETDGLKFYDGQDEGIHPKPPPDPCRRVANQPAPEPPRPPPCPPPAPVNVPPTPAYRENFVLMPEKYNIRNLRPPEDPKKEADKDVTFKEFIESKTANVRTCSKLYPQMKENILYDLVRNCPLPPFDPTKADPPPRRPPEPECPQPIRYYYRRYSTFSPLQKPNYAKVLNRMKSEDSSEKCKARKLVPKPRECPPPPKGPSCNETELPCCPKAKIPPRCDVKKPMPPCKKKLAPKPSYSECSKDPPPCPRITECNAWEKRDMENQKKGPSKGRRFSNWAAEQDKPTTEKDMLKADDSSYQASNTVADDCQAPGPSYSEYLDLKNRGQSLNKNKWSPHKQRKVFSGKELMLNFMNPTEDTNSYYKSDSLVRRRKPQWRKLKSAQSKSKKSDQSVGNQLHERKVISALLQDHHTRNDVRIRNVTGNDREAALTLYSADDGSKAGAGSIGSWINGLVKVPGKRSNSCPPASNKTSQSGALTYVETVDVDRIMKLTKPFRHKLKSHSFENLTYYPVDSAAGYQKKNPSPFRRLWGRNRNRSLLVFPKVKRERARSSLWKYETLSPTVNHEKVIGVGAKSARTGDQAQKPVRKPLQRKDAMPRLDLRKPKDYAVPDSISERTLFLSVTESPNSALNEFANKNGLRCYTMASTPFNESASGIIAGKNQLKRYLLRPPTSPAMKRSISKFSITTRGVTVVRKPKYLLEWKRSETNTPSPNPVKPVKAGRPPKKKESLESPKQAKVKFMQSATSSLVSNIIAQKELEKASRGNGDGKLTPYTAAEKAVMPLAIPQKSWIYIDRGYDNNMKYDFKKTIAHATVIKSKPKKWFQDIEEFPNDSRDYIYDGKKGKRKAGENVLKDDLKYCADKYLKRQEVRNMLSKLEVKKSVLKVADSKAKVRQKEQGRKDMMSILDHHSCSHSPDKMTSGRFGWQHALFRSNAKLVQKSVVEIDPDPPEPTDLHQIKSLIDVRDAVNEVKTTDTSLSDGDIPKKLNNNVELYDANLDVVEYINVDDKPSNLRVDSIKKKQKDKAKWSNEKDGVIVNLGYEKVPALSVEKREARPITTAAARQEMPAPKSRTTESPRRYTTYTRNTSKKWNATHDKNPCEDANSQKNKVTSDSSQTEKDKSGTRTDKGRKLDESKDELGSCLKEPGMGVKKPGPNCPDV